MCCPGVAMVNLLVGMGVSLCLRWKSTAAKGNVCFAFSSESVAEGTVSLRHLSCLVCVALV